MTVGLTTAQLLNNNIIWKNILYQTDGMNLVDFVIA